MQFKTIGQLVVFRLKKDLNYPNEKLTKEVKKINPKSKWSLSHYTWYKSAVKNGRLNKVVKSLGGLNAKS